MKREVVNTFDEGMIRDLNPINMPPKALTDCLNGTLVTYDDNELSLQNDKGNYPLRNCRLPEGYVPVGVQEYAGILYIISYNPIEDKVQVGSYPTPAELSSSAGTPATFTINVLDNIDTGSVYTYEKFSDDNKQTILIGSGGENNWITYPGDEYILTPLSITAPAYYEYSLIDSDHNITNISSLIKTTNNNTFKKVLWKKAGWVAVTPKLPNILDFNINVGNLRIIGGTKLKYSFNVQIESDRDDLLNYLGITFITKNYETPSGGTAGWTTQEEEFTSTGSKLNKLSLPNGRTVYYFNLNSEVTLSGESAVVPFTFKPYILYNSNKHYYKSHEKTLSVNTDDRISASDIKLGEDIFKYSIIQKATDASQGYIEFTVSTSNLDSLAILDGEYVLEYKISKRNWTNATWTATSGDWIELDGFNAFGTNAIPVYTSVFNSTNEANSEKLFAEDLYKIQLRIKDADNETYPNSDGKSFVTYVTELMDGISVNKCTEVIIEDFIDKYPSTFKEKKATLTFTNAEFTEDCEIVPSNGYELFIRGTNFCGGKYTRAFTETSIKNTIGDSVKLNVNTVMSGTPSVTSDASILAGPLWKALLSNSGTGMLIDGVKRGSFDPYTGIIDFTNSGFTSGEFANSGEIGYKISIINGLKREAYGYSIKPLVACPSKYCGIDSTLDHSSNYKEANKASHKEASSLYCIRTKLNTSGDMGSNTPIFTVGGGQYFNHSIFKTSLRKLMQDFPLMELDVVINKTWIAADSRSKNLYFGRVGVDGIQQPYHASASENSAGEAKYMVFYSGIIDNLIFYRLTKANDEYQQYVDIVEKIGKLNINDIAFPETWEMIYVNTDVVGPETIPVSVKYDRILTFGRVEISDEGLLTSFDNINLSPVLYKADYEIDATELATYTDEIEDKNDETQEQFEDFRKDSYLNLSPESVGQLYVNISSEDDVSSENTAANELLPILNGTGDMDRLGTLAINGRVVVAGSNNNDVGTSSFGKLII